VTGGTGRLGNITFSIDRFLFAEAGGEFGDLFDAVIRNNDTIVWEGVVPYSKSFGSVPVGDNLLFINSSGFASITINQHNFADKYGIDHGDDWLIELKKQ